MNKSFLILLATILAVASSQLTASAQTYTFTGAIDNDFYNVGNWDDGLGGMPGSLASPIALDLVIDGSSVSAATAFTVTTGGSLTLSSTSTLDVGTGNLVFGTGTFLDVIDSTLNLNVNASQLQLNAGSTTSLNGAVLNVGDDVFFRSTVSILDSRVVSRVDDIEFQDTASITGISGSEFETLDLVQIVSFQVPSNVSDTTFTTGRLSLETGANMVATDSTFDLNGDIDDAFNDISFAELTLQGTTTLEADQLDEGITIFLKDSAQASFVDDDQEGEWLTASSAGTGSRPSTVVFLSKEASLTFAGPQDPTNDATQIINGLAGAGAAYADFPLYFSPSNWDGQSNVTITLALVPEPSSILLALAVVAGLVVDRR